MFFFFYSTVPFRASDILTQSVKTQTWETGSNIKRTSDTFKKELRRPREAYAGRDVPVNEEHEGRSPEATVPEAVRGLGAGVRGAPVPPPQAPAAGSGR